MTRRQPILFSNDRTRAYDDKSASRRAASATTPSASRSAPWAASHRRRRGVLMVVDQVISRPRTEKPKRRRVGVRLSTTVGPNVDGVATRPHLLCRARRSASDRRSCLHRSRSRPAASPRQRSSPGGFLPPGRPPGLLPTATSCVDRRCVNGTARRSGIDGALRRALHRATYTDPRPRRPPHVLPRRRWLEPNDGLDIPGHGRCRAQRPTTADAEADKMLAICPKGDQPDTGSGTTSTTSVPTPRRHAGVARRSHGRACSTTSLLAHFRSTPASRRRRRRRRLEPLAVRPPPTQPHHPPPRRHHRRRLRSVPL